MNLDIVFPKMPCDVIGLNLVDTLGNSVADYYGELHKHRLTESGRDLGVESWQEKNVARTEVRDRTQKELDEKQGCRFEGYIELNRVPGNFHISTYAFADMIQSLEQKGYHFDNSFTINHVSFGEKKHFAHLKGAFPDTDI